MNEILGPLYEDEEAEPPEEKTEKFAKDYAQELAAIGEDEESTIEIKYPEGYVTNFFKKYFFICILYFKSSSMYFFQKLFAIFLFF